MTCTVQYVQVTLLYRIKEQLLQIIQCGYCQQEAIT